MISNLIIKLVLTSYILLVLFLNGNTYGDNTIPISGLIANPVFTSLYILFVLIVAFLYDKVAAVLLMIILCIWINEYTEKKDIKLIQHFEQSNGCAYNAKKTESSTVDTNGVFRLPKAQADPKPNGSYDLIPFGTPEDDEDDCL